MKENKSDLWQSDLIWQAIKDSVPKLDPRRLWRNPVMFAVELGGILTTLIAARDLASGGNFGFDVQISIWLWFTILFANFAEALAEGRGRAQAETLRQARSEAKANRLLESGRIEEVSALDLQQRRPCTGEGWRHHTQRRRDCGRGGPGGRVGHYRRVGSRRSRVGGSLCGVTGGTRVLSGKVKIRITADPGETFLDQMIGMVESAKRQKTPNEQALEILLIGLTGLFIVVVDHPGGLCRIHGALTYPCRCWSPFWSA